MSNLVPQAAVQPQPGSPDRWTPHALQPASAAFREHYPKLVNFARRFRDPEEAADIVSEAMVRFLERLQRGEIPASAAQQEAALFNLVRDISLQRRRRVRRRSALAALITGPTAAMRREANASLPTAGREIEACVHTILQAMPRRWAETFTLTHDHAMSYEGIGAMLGVSASTARANHARACRRLRDGLLNMGLDLTDLRDKFDH